MGVCHWLHSLSISCDATLDNRWTTINPFSESLTNVCLDGETCPVSVVELTSAFVETVTDALRDGRMDSCLNLKTLAQKEVRILIPSPHTLHGIRVFSLGIESCSPAHGMTMFGVTGCYDEVPCELRMCVVQNEMERSDGLLCRFACLGYNHRYVIVTIQHNALNQDLCEINLH